MAPVFKPYMLMRTEDQKAQRGSTYVEMMRSPKLIQAFGESPYNIDSAIGDLDELPDAEVKTEISRIETEVNKIGDGTIHLGVANGQVARAALDLWIPGVIVSDSGFPMNGLEIVKWLKAHGYNDYPLIGFSSTDFRNLEPEAKAYFEDTPNAEYFSKWEVSSPFGDSPGSEAYHRLIDAIVRSQKANIEKYGKS